MQKKYVFPVAALLVLFITVYYYSQHRLDWLVLDLFVEYATTVFGFVMWGFTTWKARADNKYVLFSILFGFITVLHFWRSLNGGLLC